jgi:hypothetical protein
VPSHPAVLVFPGWDVKKESAAEAFDPVDGASQRF